MLEFPAVVSWDPDRKKPFVKPDPIVVPLGLGAATIHWTCDETITDFEITGLDPNVFTAPAVTSPVKKYSTGDKNMNRGTYSYHVKGKHAGSGRVGEHDPKIENGGGVTS